MIKFCHFPETNNDQKYKLKQWLNTIEHLWSFYITCLLQAAMPLIDQSLIGHPWNGPVNEGEGRVTSSRSTQLEPCGASPGTGGPGYGKVRETFVCYIHVVQINVYIRHTVVLIHVFLFLGDVEKASCVWYIYTLAWFGWWAWVSARRPVHHCVQLEATMSCPTSLCQSFRCSCTLQGRLWLRQQLRRTGSV